MEKKPAESAAAYLIAEDKRIYDARARVKELLVKERFGSYTIFHELASQADNLYKSAEKSAERFWGVHEINEVRDRERAWDSESGHTGDFWHRFLF